LFGRWLNGNRSIYPCCSIELVGPVYYRFCRARPGILLQPARGQSLQEFFMDEKRSNHDPLPWLVLSRANSLSSVKLSELVSIFGDAGQITGADAGRLAGLGLTPAGIRSLHHPDWRSIEADLRWLESPGNSLLLCCQPDYPGLLREITDPPPCLFVRGNTAALGTMQIAVVGSRKPSHAGRRTATAFARALARQGVTVTSGLAAGIDSAAHHGALEENGITVAVLGCGPDRIYPPNNESLAESICEDGAVISEFPPGTRPYPGNFPRRNRIISGLSAGTLVVEAAARSGSLITARLAMEQGREVFAIPGSVYNPLTRGCHALIRNGAKLTENIEDILEETWPLAAQSAENRDKGDVRADLNERLDEGAKLLLDNIGNEPVTLDFLIEETRISANSALAALLKLEFYNLIELLPGGSYMRKI